MQNRVEVRLKHLIFIILQLHGLVCVSAELESEKQVECVLQQISEGETNQAATPTELNTFEDLLTAFSRGLVPDFSIAENRQAFDIYRRMRLGDPNTPLDKNTLERIAHELKKHPELDKEPFRNMEIIVQEKTYLVSPELKKFTEKQLEKAGQVKKNFFEIEANLGYWKKVFSWQPEDIQEGTPGSKENTITPPSKDATKEEIKKYNQEYQKESQKRFLEYLDKIIPSDTRKALSDPTKPVKEKVKLLFGILNKEREKLVASNKDTKPISQALVDLIHTIGFQDPNIVQGLKSKDGLERISQYRRIINARDTLAEELGYTGHFAEVLKTFNIRVPTGIDSEENLQKTLQELEAQTLANPQITANQNSSRTLRHLSLIESPLRSCVGGSDCSSRTYLTKALDPNYHYFTLTDAQGYSSGQITIVLGEAKDQNTNQKIKVAFIDKVMNIPNVDLPMMLEAIRQSVLEKGYTLVLPQEKRPRGEGIANDQMTLDFLNRSIPINKNENLLSFTPHKHNYHFPDEYGYSSADREYTTNAVLPLNLTAASEGIEIKEGELIEPTKINQINLEKLVEGSYKLKQGDVESKIRYISSMQAIQKANLKTDPEFEATLQNWITNLKEPLKLRRQVLNFKWQVQNQPLAALLKEFSSENNPGNSSENIKDEQITILQNLLDTPRYKEKIFKEKGKKAENILDLILIARHNRKIREQLIAEYAPKHRENIEKILESAIDNVQAKQAIISLKDAIDKEDIKAYIELAARLTNTPLKQWVEEEIPKRIARAMVVEFQLSKTLFDVLDSENSAKNEFALKIIEEVSKLDPSLTETPTVKTYTEILNTVKTSKTKTFQDTTVDWIKNKKTTARQKAEFLLTTWENEKLFETLMQALPAEEKQTVIKAIEERSNVFMFEAIAKQKGVYEFFRKHARIESFLYTHFEFPEEGKEFTIGSPASEPERFDNEPERKVILKKAHGIAATAVTQLQYVLVRELNPSEFKSDGPNSEIEITIDSMKVKLSPNKPVEKISYNDTVEYFKILSKLDPNYNYDLPTEAQWEVAARAGSKTPYYFGSTEEELNVNGWYTKNSENQTQEVAKKRPNKNGLHDVAGNVWEWVKDKYESMPHGGVDPEGPTEGTGCVLRGGGWDSYAGDLRFARRFGGHPDDRSDVVGCRPLRTRKP